MKLNDVPVHGILILLLPVLSPSVSHQMKFSLNVCFMQGTLPESQRGGH